MTAGGIETDDRTGAVREAPEAVRARVVDYDAAADFYFARQQRQMRYQSFGHASLAIQFALEELTEAQFRTCSMDVGDERFSNADIRRLYEAEGYPLPRVARAAKRGPIEAAQVRPLTRPGDAGAPHRVKPEGKLSAQRGEGKATLPGRAS